MTKRRANCPAKEAGRAKVGFVNHGGTRIGSSAQVSSLLDRHYFQGLAQWVTSPATSTLALLAGGSLGISLTSTMDRETEGAGNGGWGAGGPTAGVTTTLPLQVGKLEKIWFLFLVFTW